jgi:hypothetical protein
MSKNTFHGLNTKALEIVQFNQDFEQKVWCFHSSFFKLEN